MERTDEYRKALDVPISELSIDRIIEEIRRQPENFEALYHLTTDEKLLVSWRALWVCDKLCRQYPDWFAPLREELTGRLVTCKHDGSSACFSPYSTMLPPKKSHRLNCLTSVWIACCLATKA